MAIGRLYFFYKNSFNETYKIEYTPYEYNSVMELIWDQAYEEWGDCKGRAWCGTCHVKVISNNFQNKDIDDDEIQCLDNQENRTSQSRLSCQIKLTKKLHLAQLEYLGDT